jgi:hypothetical protein
VVLGDDAAAAAMQSSRGVLWVGALAPADRTSRAWDDILLKHPSRVSELGLVLDSEGRVAVEVALPSLVSVSTPRRDEEDVPLELLRAAARRFSSELAALTGDAGILAVTNKSCYLDGEDKFALYIEGDGHDNTGHGTHVLGSLAGSSGRRAGGDQDGVAKHARMAFLFRV